MDQTSDIHRLCGGRLTILSGDDSLTLPLMALGGQGRGRDGQQSDVARDA